MTEILEKFERPIFDTFFPSFRLVLFKILVQKVKKHENAFEAICQTFFKIYARKTMRKVMKIEHQKNYKIDSQMTEILEKF